MAVSDGLNQKEQELLRVLSAAPADKVAELAAHFELEKLKSGGRNAGIMLGAIRERLRQIRPPRCPTPQRLFCAAFEDLLVNERARKLQGRIARTSIEPVWRWLGETAMPGRFRALVREITVALLERDASRKARLVANLQIESAAAIDAALTAAPEGSPARAKLTAAMGGPMVIEDAAEMALMLEVGDALKPMQTVLPRPIEKLTESHLIAIRTIFDDFAEKHAQQAPYIALAAMGRMARPWEILTLTRVVSRQTNRAMLGGGDFGAVGESLLADMEEMAADIAEFHRERLDADALLDVVDRLAQLSGALGKELKNNREAKFGKRFLKLRRNAASHLEALLARGAQETMAAFPTARFGGYAKGSRRPDLSHDPDAARVAHARNCAELIVRLRPYCAGMDFLAAYEETLDAAAGSLRQYCEALLIELKSADGEERGRAAAFLARAETVAEVLFAEEETAALKRRVAAALAA